MAKDIPAPGTKEARDQGCDCPVDENQGGAGAMVSSGEPGKTYFAVNDRCSIHGWQKEE